MQCTHNITDEPWRIHILCETLYPFDVEVLAHKHSVPGNPSAQILRLQSRDVYEFFMQALAQPNGKTFFEVCFITLS